MTEDSMYAPHYRWDQRDFRRIDRAKFDEDLGLLTVSFDDGTSVTFDPVPLVPSDLDEIDWWRTTANEIEVIVPHASGWFEIPWDVVRRHTDPEYAAHWERMSDARRADRESNASVMREEPPEFG